MSSSARARKAVETRIQISRGPRLGCREDSAKACSDTARLPFSCSCLYSCTYTIKRFKNQNYNFLVTKNGESAVKSILVGLQPQFSDVAWTLCWARTVTNWHRKGFFSYAWGFFCMCIAVVFRRIRNVGEEPSVSFSSATGFHLCKLCTEECQSTSGEEETFRREKHVDDTRIRHDASKLVVSGLLQILPVALFRC